MHYFSASSLLLPTDEHFESKDQDILSRKDIVMCVRQVCDMMTARACEGLLRNFPRRILNSTMLAPVERSAPETLCRVSLGD